MAFSLKTLKQGMRKDEDLFRKLRWPFGEEFLGARHFLARIQHRPFAELETEKGLYRFFARANPTRPYEVSLEVTWCPDGEEKQTLSIIYRSPADDLERALELVQRHIAEGQPLGEWEGAEVEAEEEEGYED